MEWIVAVGVALILVPLLVFAVSQKRNPRIRMREWNHRLSYVRLYPNPGFTVKGRHWCKAKGRGSH